MPKIIQREAQKSLSPEATESIQPIQEYIAELEAEIRLLNQRAEYAKERKSLKKPKDIEPILTSGKHMRLVACVTCKNCKEKRSMFASFAIVRPNGALARVDYRPSSWEDHLLHQSADYCLACTKEN